LSYLLLPSPSRGFGRRLRIKKGRKFEPCDRFFQELKGDTSNKREKSVPQQAIPAKPFLRRFARVYLHGTGSNSGYVDRPNVTLGLECPWEDPPRGLSTARPSACGVNANPALPESVDHASAAPYHEWMPASFPALRRFPRVAGPLGCAVFFSLALASTITAQAATPAQSGKASKSNVTSPTNLPDLPLYNPARRRTLWLTPLAPPTARRTYVSASAPATQEERGLSKEALIRSVEEKFASGEQNYKAGHLEAARKDFDQAMDELLASPYDLGSDPQLSELFHRMVDTVYTDELQAFRAGDGFNEAPAVPAAIDEVAEMTFPVDPRLKARAEEAAKNISHDLPLTVNDEVLSFLNFFQTPHGRAIVENGLRRAGRYREMIARVLAQEGVPQDLIYLAQAESAFQPTALSRAGARGMWQFVAYRGQEYGLRHTWWLDERQDPEKATHAAAQHLRDLYLLFGDWYLAMAAYNCGPGNVQKAIERTGYADFWELYRRNVLPRETKNYVPIILALTLIAKDAPHYGIQAEPEAPVPSDVVKPGRAIDLRLVAETIDVDVETLRSLNPSLLRLATPDDPSFELHLPAGTAERFSAEIADIPADKWVSWRRHRVAPGETLTAIAKKYHVTAKAIAEANSLESQTSLNTGEKIIIPAIQPEAESKRHLVSYRVRKGDTLGGIADRFGVETDDVRKWNKLSANHVRSGMVLRIYSMENISERSAARTKAHAKGTARVQHKTKPGTSAKTSTAQHSSAAAKSDNKKHPSAVAQNHSAAANRD
jgi:peptidoglycan lytic transglycosylase D